MECEASRLAAAQRDGAAGTRERAGMGDGLGHGPILARTVATNIR
jgi:hypothetical protein